MCASYALTLLNRRIWCSVKDRRWVQGSCTVSIATCMFRQGLHAIFISGLGETAQDPRPAQIGGHQLRFTSICANSLCLLMLCIVRRTAWVQQLLLAHHLIHELPVIIQSMRITIVSTVAPTSNYFTCGDAHLTSLKADDTMR